MGSSSRAFSFSEAIPIISPTWQADGWFRVDMTREEDAQSPVDTQVISTGSETFGLVLYRTAELSMASSAVPAPENSVLTLIFLLTGFNCEGSNFPTRRFQAWSNATSTVATLGPLEPLGPWRPWAAGLLQAALGFFLAHSVVIPLLLPALLQVASSWCRKKSKLYQPYYLLVYSLHLLYLDVISSREWCQTDSSAATVCKS